MELQGRVGELKKSGLGLAAISDDSPAILKAFAEKYGISYPLLSDRGSEVIKRYGILNTTLDAGNPHYGIPFPGTFILDPDGKVSDRFFEPAYQERSTSSSIAIKLGGQDGRAGERKSTLHLAITTFASDAVVAPGNRFSIVLDIAPRRGMHVYAPPQTNYRPVALAIKEQPGVTVHPLALPRGEEYLFKPLNERVQVYQKPFRIVQDLTLSASREMQAQAAAPDAMLKVEGTLSYQACDEAVCYLPEAVPLTWTFKLKPLNRP